MRTASLLLLVAGALCAQTIDRTKEPVTAAVPDFKLPPLYETKLPNGLRVILASDTRFPLVSLRLNFQAGSKFDPAGLTGLASNTAGLLTEGTKTRTSRQIAELLDSIGGSLNGGAGPDSLGISGNAVSDRLTTLLDLLADVVQNASFPDDEVALRKQNAIQGLAARRANPAFQAEEKLYQTVFGSHPYARYSPTRESIEKLDRAAMVKFRDTYLVPNNATLILVGRTPPREQALKLITRYFGTWTRKDVPELAKGQVPAPKRQIVLVDRPGSVQADVHVGRIAPLRSSPEYFSLMVGNAVFGGGASSRMFQIIREKQGFAYDAHSEYDTRREAAMVKAVTQVRNDVVEPALKSLMEQMDAMGQDRVTAAELSTVKNLIGGSYLIRFETQDGLATNLASMDSLGLPSEFLETANRQMRNVEPDQMQTVAKKYLAAGDNTIVVVGDASKIGETLKKFGDVTVTRAN